MDNREFAQTLIGEFEEDAKIKAYDHGFSVVYLKGRRDRGVPGVVMTRDVDESRLVLTVDDRRVVAVRVG